MRRRGNAWPALIALIPRIVFRVNIVKAKRPNRRHLGDVFARFCPMGVGGITRQDHYAARRIGLHRIAGRDSPVMVRWVALRNAAPVVPGFVRSCLPHQRAHEMPGVFRMMFHDRLTPPLTSLSRHSSIQVARNPWKGHGESDDVTVEPAVREDADSKAPRGSTLLAGLSRRAATNITQLRSTSQATVQEYALSFIVLPLSPRRAAVAGSRAYRKWRGAAPLRGR
jgi:hypothetical protein